MSEQKPISQQHVSPSETDQPPVPAPRCMYLSCKSMQVYGEDFESDPDYQSGMVDFWCNQTFQGQGPDHGGVSMELCCNPERPCYREY